MRANIGWDETIRYIFYGVAAFMFHRATGILDKLQNDVSELNTRVITVVVKSESKFEAFDYRLNLQGERINDLERDAKSNRNK